MSKVSEGDFSFILFHKVSSLMLSKYWCPSNVIEKYVISSMFESESPQCDFNI